MYYGADFEAQPQMWADHFGNVFTEKSRDSYLEDKYSPPISEPPEPVSKAELTEIISKLESGKAIGLDGASAWEFQNAPDTLLTNLQAVYTHILSTAIFPKSMLQHKISIIPKSVKKDLTMLKSWRPIQVQNCTLAIFERILLRRNRAILTDTSKEQFGYKSQVGTEMAVAVARAIKGRAFACCIDYSSAFDMVSWKRIMDQLQLRNMAYAYRKVIFKSFQIGTCIAWLGSFIKVKNPSRGVKQGGILAPYLFAISMQQLADANAKLDAGVTLQLFDKEIFLNTIVYNQSILFPQLPASIAIKLNFG